MQQAVCAALEQHRQLLQQLAAPQQVQQQMQHQVQHQPQQQTQQQVESPAVLQHRWTLNDLGIPVTTERTTQPTAVETAVEMAGAGGRHVEVVETVGAGGGDGKRKNGAVGGDMGKWEARTRRLAYLVRNREYAAARALARVLWAGPQLDPFV